ncbi:hypothetical protein P9222_25785 [Paenibacillus amylolyticus]|nr:hypothetical protein [Paenibacillus amylolyticus]WFR61753.1 hypothetical protein P9222_25785 [Paenibacillus amylolyticus]
MNLPPRDLAQYIAKRSHIVVKAAVRAENEQGELLLIQHAGHGHWRLPAGEMRPGRPLKMLHIGSYGKRQVGLRVP